VKVRDALVADPRVVDARAPIREAAELLGRPNVESVLVADGGRLVGLVTTSSLVAALARGDDLRQATAGQIADGDVETVGPDEQLDEVLVRMGEHDLERVAVVEDGRLLGVLPREPIVRRLAEDEPPPDPEDREGPQA
jgi:CBS domain-containing protein